MSETNNDEEITMTETTTQPEFVKREGELQFSDDHEAYVDIEFGGRCNGCDEELVKVPGEFGRLTCPSCSIVYAPEISYCDVREDSGKPSDEDEWYVGSSSVDVEDGLLSISIRYRGDCYCGGEATAMRKNVEEPMIGSPSGVVCPECNARASYGMLVHNVLNSDY